MSETDDTDDLLLIPPDFFLNQVELTEPYLNGPYFSIVDTLIAHVNQLQYRVNTIDSMDQHSKYKYKSSDDLCKGQSTYVNSSFSTPQKPRSRYKLNSLSNTPSSTISPHSTHRRQMLKDIDKFIEGNARRSLNYADSKDLKEVNKLLSDIEEKATREKTWKCGEDSNSIPHLAYDICNNDKFQKLSVSALGSDNTTADSQLADKSGSASSSDSTQITAKRNLISPRTDNLYRDVRSVMEMHEEMIMNENKRLMSLKDLWGRDQGDFSNKSFQERFEEEKLRRQHCEQLIQQLQSKILELQERLAVAVEVDESKDKAITKFHDAWDQVGSRLQLLTKQRDALDREVDTLKTKIESVRQESTKKIAHYEAEASKALNLAHGNQEKTFVLEEENLRLKSEILRNQETFQKLNEDYVTELERNRQLTEVIAQKELDLKESRAVLEGSRKEVAQSKAAVEMCQVEFANMKAQYTQVEMLLNDKQAQIKELEIQKKNIFNDNENLKLLQRNSQEELKTVKASAEKSKAELRNFYQDQVEAVVREKLREFQAQLDKAEGSLHDEIKNRELSIAKTAASHIHQLSEKHSLEVSLLEEKQKEEVRLYRVQLSHSQQRIDHLQSKLQQLSDRRATIAQELRKVMEAQWMEAIKIIDNVKTPSLDMTMDKLHSLKSKSFTNMEEVLSDKCDEEKFNHVPSSSTMIDGTIYETPIVNKGVRARKQIESDLQKYVHMLLLKHSEETTSSEKASNHENGVWPMENGDDPRSKFPLRRGSKPPWK